MAGKILLINNLYTESENLRVACRTAQLDFDEVRHTDIARRDLDPSDYIGVVLSGTGDSPDEKLHVYADELALLTRIDCPVLGICGGAQILVLGAEGGRVDDTDAPVAGRKQVAVLVDDPLFSDLPRPFTVFSKHRRYISAVPDGYETLAEETGARFPYVLRKTGTFVYAVQFHPERRQDGTVLMQNFFGLCRTWAHAQSKAIARLQETAA